MYLLYNCLIWVFLEASEQWPSLCDWSSPSSKDFLEAVIHQLCGSLGSAPRWVERNIPLGTPPYPTAPRKVKVLFDHKLAALPMPVRVLGQYQVFSKTCGGHVPPCSQGHKDCAMYWEMFKDTSCTHKDTTFCLHSTERNAWAKSSGSSRRGTNKVRQVLLYSILHWCQLLKSFFPMSDGTAWNLQIPGACLKDAAWAGKGWYVLPLPETGGTAWGQRGWGNPLYSIIWL